MKYIIDINKLRPGDIILAGYNEDKSKQIQERTNSLYSHAMLFGEGTIIHATSTIVITGNPSRDLYDEGEHVCILRPRPENSDPLRIKSLLSYAKSFVGTLYDKKALDAMAEGVDFVPNPNRQMCARLVAQCYDHVFIDLVDDYETCSPQELINYEFSSSEIQRDDIEYAISEYVTMMSPELLDYISDGRPAFLREHSSFEDDMREAVSRMGEQLGERF